jgi:hypothetical protein
MSDRTAWFLAGVGGILAFVVWKWGNPIVAAQIAENWAENLIGRGNALSQSTLSNGIVEEIPSVLQDMATAVLGFNAELDTYSLARMGRSEGVDGEEYRMHVLLNDLADLQRTYGTGVYSSITALLIHSKIAAADGHYSSQDEGKRYSTAHDPYEADYALAQKVLVDHASGEDPTGGAIKFVDKSGPFYVDGEKTDYDGLVAAWAANGLTPDDSLPNATTNFVVFRRNA